MYAFINLVKKKEMDLICQYFGFDYGELAVDMRKKYFNYYESYAFESILYFNSFNCPENVTKIDLCIFHKNGNFYFFSFIGIFFSYFKDSLGTFCPV